MKLIRIYILIFCCVATLACDDDILNEVPKDVLSPENSFTNKEGFESAVAQLYLDIRTDLYAPANNWDNFDLFGLDVDLATRMSGNNAYTEYFFWDTFNADHSALDKWWPRFYKWIYNSNVIIDRAESDIVDWASEEEKNAIVAEARFMRAFSYKFLANMWGGVPLVIHETTDAKFDYERASQEEVYQQCKEDLEFAVQWMKTVDELKPGRAPRAAAYHLLAEINIGLKDYAGAIAAASAVINDPNYSLMTARFGAWTDFTFNGYDYRGPQMPWGDVYWDLFREGNFNWKDGNHEAIWNIQFDPYLEGGGEISNNFVLERWWSPDWWRTKDINGESNWLKDTLSGRPNNADVISDYAGRQVWEFKDDWDNDIRNSEFNIQRTYYWTNPASEFYGQPITKDNASSADLSLWDKRLAPYVKKAAGTVHIGFGGVDSQSGDKHDNGLTYKDWYIMRLAETYLLRAEAYHLAGDNGNAANDINAVRSRAQATPVIAGEVSLDLIIDERARELYMEEFRLSTLTRMNKLQEQLMKYNPATVSNGYSLPPHLNKLPIPQSEIEKNKDKIMEQNPGY